MKRIDGIQIGSQIFKYGSKVFQTNGGFLLKFAGDTDQWLGMFPGCSWDQFYDEVMVDLIPQCNPTAVMQRLTIPTVMMSFKAVGTCTKCSSNTDYKFCSVSCWFFDTIEMVREVIANSDNQNKINQQIDLVQRMAAKFGDLVNEEQLNPTQL